MGERVDLACTRCPLCAGRTQVVPGKGPARAALVLVGEAPGADEDREGEPFVGRAGGLLDKALAQAGIDRGSVFITNVVKCRPPANRKPTPAEAQACRPFLEGEIERVGARVALALGATAAEALAGGPVKVSEARSAPIAAKVGAAALRVHPTLHPASSRFRKGALEEIGRAAAAAADDAGLPRKSPPAQTRLKGA
jgi:uracil-DNA glycosylase family 4